MYIADLHIHSRFSRATSKEGTPEHLDLWARKKGIHIVGTGDFTHPAWRQELQEKLQPAQEGFYTLKREYKIQDNSVADTMTPRFVVTGEISSIYKKNGRVRKIHNLILLPSLEDAEIVSKKLETIGNIHSDGRPILGLDAKDLLEILLELSPNSILVPAHIWTPHFSLFGAFSGFDTVEECFEDLSGYIHAMETGLSSDPPMNWRISALDRYQLISNSDAHSPSKLGREANLLNIDLSYEGLKGAIEEGKGLLGTVEFFPEEGKYHFDGHRKCNLCLSPQEAEKYHGICPVCGKKLTIGVSHRVEQLADREEGYIRPDAKAFESLVPLPEVIAASLGCGPSSSQVLKEYSRLLQKLGPEFEILRQIPVEEISRISGFLIGEGIRRLREKQVERIPGFDGEYGKIQLFTAEELRSIHGQISFFDMIGIKTQPSVSKKKISVNQIFPKNEKSISPKVELNQKETLNAEQKQAVEAIDRVTAVIAGPGTGKTKTLVSHILHLMEVRKVKPSQITAVTFTNKAAQEMAERLQRLTGKKKTIQQMQIGTFHAICLDVIREQNPSITLADETEMLLLADSITKEQGLSLTNNKFLRQVSAYKTSGELQLDESDSSRKEAFKAAVEEYIRQMREKNMMDFDDLLTEGLRLSRSLTTDRFQYLLVDEFQDISPLQYALIQSWNRQGRELFVIGDPDQSIYGFRGSDAHCFERLKKDFPELHLITLTENYRSTPEILSAATMVISQNPGGTRVLHPYCLQGRPVRQILASSDLQSAIYIAKEINRMVGGIDMLDAQLNSIDCRKQRGFGEFVILYRTHRQADLIEKCLKQESIPYVVAGRDDFLMEKSVRGTLCFFRSLQNPSAVEDRRLCLKLLWEMEENDLSKAFYDNMAAKFLPMYTKAKPTKVLDVWKKELNFSGDEGIEKLAGMSVFYDSMSKFLEAIQLGVESDLRRCGTKEYTSDALTLMTMHGSKGLEFPVVFISGVQKGMIPYENDFYEADLEEERRLFFVGMTRAKEELILMTVKEQSPFMEGLSPNCIQSQSVERKKVQEKVKQLSLFD